MFDINRVVEEDCCMLSAMNFKRQHERSALGRTLAGLTARNVSRTSDFWVTESGHNSYNSSPSTIPLFLT